MPEGFKVDVAKAIGSESKPELVECNCRDYLLYALSVGVPDTELQWLYENADNFGPLPTYPLSLLLKKDYDVNVFAERFGGKSSVPGESSIPGIPEYNLDCVVHGEQTLEVINPFPVLGGQFRSTKKVIDVGDKGSGMVVTSVQDLYGAVDGIHYCRMQSKMFVRGYGGWNGPKGLPSPSYKPPKDKKPDATVSFETGTHQALLYRLCGDFNPLHADPKVAQSVGLPMPILHGLCSYGRCCHAVISTFGNNDRHRFKSITARFAFPVLPGQTVDIDMWKVPHDSNHFGVIFNARVGDRVVLNNGYVVLANESTAKL
ncbi:unnamed protein product [Cunninghamella echinulata]